MSRELKYSNGYKCDNCGKLGATNFMGDYVCNDCLIWDKDGYVIGVKELGKEYPPNPELEIEDNDPDI